MIQPAAPETARTPLYELHIELGARMVPFAGWEMPVQYPTGIIAEHQWCRESAALFDVSHMGQVTIRGDGAAAAFERLVPADVQDLGRGRARYTVLTNAAGGIEDDLIVANAGDHLLIVVNAGGRAHDLALMQAALAPSFDVMLHRDRALLALQGPQAATALTRLAPACQKLGFMSTAEMSVGGLACRVSRLGYTGEDGFEISLPAGQVETLARRLLAQPEVKPAGLGARDSLRLEAGLCLYGHDINATTTPVEAQLHWTIQKRRRQQGGFPGADVILRQLADGPPRKLVGITLDSKAPAREGSVIRADGHDIGKVTSGGYGPTVGGPIAMGYVEAAFATPGTAVELIVRNKLLAGRVASLPFVPHRYHR